MKIGFNMLLWTSHITEEDFPIPDKLKKVGYDGIEVPVFEGDTSHFEKIGMKHLSNSKEIFLRLLDISRGLDESQMQTMIAERDYEELDLYIMKSLLG